MICDGDEIEHNGRMFTIKLSVDEDMEPPWKNSDGHGIVHKRDFRSDRRGGEWVMNNPGNHAAAYCYDSKASYLKARKEGWGLNSDDQAKLCKALGVTTLTKGQIVWASVKKDFEFLSGWCRNQWYYMCVDVKDTVTGEVTGCGGVESDSDDNYVLEIAHDQAEELYPKPWFEKMIDQRIQEADALLNGFNRERKEA